MTHKSTARIAARTTAFGLLAQGVPPDDIADQFIAHGLTVWAAATGRQEVAESLLRTWCEVRDAN